VSINILSGRHQQRRHHRHKKFHVRPEAKGVGYWRFLTAPWLSPASTAEAEPKAEPGEMEEESQESEENVKPKKLWRHLVLIIGLILVVAYWNTIRNLAWLNLGIQ
jgi:hypothetical protein